MAEFSIITVTYNSEDTLRRAMESVLNQTYSPKEYFIVDGKSKDSTVEIAASYKDLAAKKGIKLVIISEPDNGIYDAMNKGIKLSSGDIVGMINSDDYYELDALESVNEVYEKEQFDVFYADLNMHFKDGRSFVKKAKIRNYMTSRNWNHPTTFITKELYKDNLYKTETLHDDYDLILRVKKQGAKFSILNKPLANFTMNGVSHERDIKGMPKRIRDKYNIYRNNGYSRIYIIEPILEEVGKIILG